MQSQPISADLEQETARRKPMNSPLQNWELPAAFPTSKDTFLPCPTVMTEDELIRFLRIPEISSAGNHRHVIENLKRKHGLPRIHLCGKTVYLTDSVKQWLQRHVTCGN
jgi:hypothetical protein